MTKQEIKETPEEKYNLELLGFLGYSITKNLTLAEARNKWRLAKSETYKAYYNGEMVDQHWTGWELHKDSQLVSSGKF